MTMDHAAEYDDEGYGYWEAIARFSGEAVTYRLMPLDDDPAVLRLVPKGRHSASASWRKLSVLVDAGAVKCTARMNSPLAERSDVPPGALIHFRVAKNPPERRTGQAVLEGPNGERLYAPRFIDCTDEGEPITAGQLINYYEEAHIHQNPNWLFEATIKELAEKIHLWGRRVYPRRWTNQESTLVRELKRRRSRERPE